MDYPSQPFDCSCFFFLGIHSDVPKEYHYGLHMTQHHIHDKQFHEVTGEAVAVLLSASPKLLRELLHQLHLKSVRVIGDICVQNLSDAVCHADQDFELQANAARRRSSFTTTSGNTQLCLNRTHA